MKLSIIYISALLVECVHAASVPIIYCVNEAASADDCGPEAFQAAESTKDWFESYMSAHTNRKDDRRHLLDCSRFCNTEVKYFTIHYPCDCETGRRMTVIETSNQVRTLYDPLVGPIQLFKSFAMQLPEGKCRTILELSRCIVTFVDKYDNNFSEPEEDETDETPSDVYLNEVYNPKTGSYELYHPDTGDIVAPENVTSNNVDDDQPEEIYDPSTGKYYRVDPVSGNIIHKDGDGDNSSPTANENEDDEPEELYDPKTGKTYRVDPVTGKIIDTGGGNSSPTAGGNNEDESMEEVYDPITKTYRKIDPDTGLYINEEGETLPSGVDGDEEFDEEIYDPVSGVYHKVDPETGEYIN